MAALSVAAASCAQPAAEPAAEPTTAAAQPTTAPAQPTAAPAQPTAAPQATFKEAPALAELVKAGKLPPVDERLPENPFVVTPVDGIGKYGGELTMLIAPASDTKLSRVYGGSRMVSWDITLTQLLPDMCEKFEINEGRDFVFYFRKGLKWSDGTPFTTEDCRYYWEDMANNVEISPNGVPSWLMSGGEAPTVEISDAYTIRFTWPKVNKVFMDNLSGSMGYDFWKPAHYMKQFHVKYADKAALDKAVKDGGHQDWMALHGANDRYYNQDIPDYPTFMPWVPTFKPPQEKYTFVRNPYFYKVDTEGNQLPYLDNLVFITTDVKLIPLKCTTGDADVQQRSLSFSDITLLKDNEKQGNYETRLWSSDWATAMRILPNYCAQDKVMADLFLDKRFRIALSLGIDRAEMNDVAYLGYGVPQQIELLPGVPGYNEAWAQAYAKYDPTEANRLLDEMGLTQRDAEGYRLRPDGKTLDLLIDDAGENPVYVDLIELLTSTYKGIGIKVLYKFSDRTTYRARMSSGEATMGLWGSELGLTYATGGVIASGLFWTEGNNDGNNCWGIWHATKGTDGVEPPASFKKAQELVEQWKLTPEGPESDKIRDEIRAINAEEVYQIGTVGGAPSPIVVKNTMRNIPKEGFALWSRGGYVYWTMPCQWWKE